ncbi:MAG: Lrp/AsnC family transcriptional regulator [Desulfurococcaceae archaeon]|nr:Lrp/AsnC family transcriptional regulator [Sulfolobales archaeon]MDW8170209.1 Lrp/AsnC family transcriptional regulator [Desulfurococcaceae archaeon]
MNQYIEIDELDKDILRELRVDARQSYRRLAEKLRVSPATIIFRIRRMMKRGIVKAFTIDLDLAKLGFQSMAFIMVKLDPRKSRNSMDLLKKDPNVAELYEVTGDYHALMKVYSRDPKELANIIDRVRLTDGVNDANVIYVLRCVKEGIIEV